MKQGFPRSIEIEAHALATLAGPADEPLPSPAFVAAQLARTVLRTHAALRWISIFVPLAAAGLGAGVFLGAVGPSLLTARIR
jgi:hypothetical protein